jgi:dipeptidyl aminopeptidase/acylaminoacyl peptidase
MSRTFRLATPLLAVVALAQSLAAQAPAAQKAWNPAEVLRTETWVKPPAVIERIVMTPRVDISFTTPGPDRKWFLRATGDDRGDIVAYGKAQLNLGGVQIDTQANRARSLTTSTRRGLMLIDPRTNATRTITTPAKASISAPVWSPTGTHIAYIANFVGASHIYVADVATGVSTQVSTTPLLATFVTTVDWTADGKSVVAVVVPAARGRAPVHGNSGVEDGPWVRINDGRPNQQVVHFDLLEDPHDKAQLKYYTTGQLVVINVATKVARKVGAPGMIRSVDAAPDGQAFRVTTMLEPFSYTVPVSSFGSKQELWDATGKVVATFSYAPYREGGRGGRGGVAAAPDSAAQAGPTITNRQGLAWNPIGPGLVFTERAGGAGAGGGGAGGGGRAGGGSAGGNVRYMNWLPPYGPNDTKLLYEGSAQLGAIMYSADAKTMFVTDSGALIAFRVAEPSKRFRLPNGLTVGGGAAGGGRGGGGGGGRGAVAPGADPAQPGAVPDSASTAATGGGPLLTKTGRNGQPMVLVGTDGKTVYVRGNRTPGARWQTEAPRQWVDKVNFETKDRARVFDAAADAFEQFVTPLDDDFNQFLYTRETPTVIGDAFIRDTKTGASRQITKNKDTAPEVTRAQKKRLQITRPDSIKFWVEVTLPVDWQPGAKMPGVVWFYPREYSTQAAYDQSKYSTNINAFPEVPSARPATATKIWVTQGYVFIEPDCPIIGPAGRMNDNYTKDLQLNLKLDAVVAAGYVDRDRIGLGGHSYGAFSTMNALSLVGNTLFRAGIAGDGMYNRSLTPFGFQSERRTFYDAQSTYLDMSPFFRADKFQVPILMYHSLEDQNAGTDPISSTRMYHALNGLGKTAALYMYPYEDHSVATYTSDLDIWARWIAWFDTHVKPPKAATGTTSGG